MAAMIRLASLDDAGQIADIYSHFVLNTPVSFETEAPDEAETSRRIGTVLEQYPWLVCDVGGAVAGYAYASQHRVRYHYQWSVDVSVYVHEEFRRRGIGKALYSALLNVVPMQGFVSAFAGITLPNAASVNLHEAVGFTPVGIYRNVGNKLGKWHDVGWWQRPLVEPPTSPGTPLKLQQVVQLAMWQDGLTLGNDLLNF